MIGMLAITYEILTSPFKNRLNIQMLSASKNNRVKISINQAKQRIDI